MKTHTIKSVLQWTGVVIILASLIGLWISFSDIDRKVSLYLPFVIAGCALTFVSTWIQAPARTRQRHPARR